MTDQPLPQDSALPPDAQPVDPGAVQNDLWLLHHDEQLDEMEQSITPTRPLVTDGGTVYFQAPGCALVSYPVSAVQGVGVAGFLRSYSEEWWESHDDPTFLCPATALVKFAHQARDLALGEDRAMNRDAEQYIGQVLRSQDGSALDHAMIGMLLWGVARSTARQWGQRIAGASVMELRSAGDAAVRFVEPLEYQDHGELHIRFCDRIDAARQEFEERVETLMAQLAAQGAPGAADQRGAALQVAQGVLPDETETPLLITASIRGWRSIFDQFLNAEAEPESREAALRCFLQLHELAPLLLQDYRLYCLPDGSYAVA